MLKHTKKLLYHFVFTKFPLIATVPTVANAFETRKSSCFATVANHCRRTIRVVCNRLNVATNVSLIVAKCCCDTNFPDCWEIVTNDHL